MSDIKASEIVGSLRRMTRFFEEFKEAEKVVQVLLEQEKIQKSNEEVLALQRQAMKELDESLAQAESKLDVKIKQFEDKQKELDSMVEKAAEARQHILATAKEEAQKLVSEANQKVEGILSKISGLELAKKTAQDEYEAEAKRLKEVKAELENQKTIFGKLFKVN